MVKYIFIYFCVLFLLVELVSRFFLVPLYENKVSTVESKELVWGAKHLPLKEQNRVTGGYLGKVPHPFFGFSHFESSFETPQYYYKNEKPKYRAAIFGGSVAEHIAAANAKTLALNKFIKGKYGHDDSDIEVVSFASSGYRQPQSYFVSTIYGQHTQLAISIEGVNELADRVSDLPPYFPMGFISNLYFRSLEELNKVSSLHDKAIRESLLRDKLRTQTFFLSSVKLYYLVSRYLNLSQMTPEVYSNNSNPQYRFYKDLRWDNSSMSQRFEMWLKFSCLQQNVMKDFGVPNYFVIQPVPQNFKPLSDEERKLTDQSRAGELEIAKFMSRVDFDRLKSAGLNVIDLRKIFSLNPQTLYADSCCHFTAQGDEVFLNRVIEEIDKVIDRPLRQCDFQKLMKSLVRF